MDEVGSRVKRERTMRGWSQRDLAKRAKVTAETISTVETGQHDPRPSTLRKLANAFGVEVRELFEEPATAGKAEPRPAAGPDYLRMEHASFAEAVKQADPEGLVRIADQIRKDRDRYLAEEGSDPIRPLARLGYVVVYIDTRGTEEHKERALQIKRELSGAA